jgi:DnaK suppressor protein
MKHLGPELIEACKVKLIETKEDLLNRFRDVQKLMAEISADKGGDEGDQTYRILTEKSNLLAQKRLRETLVEVEAALARIALGKFGICEETEEHIEPERLLAIPWTRLSIEGAEARESASTFARID